VRDETVARNYAKTLFEVAERQEGLGAFGDGIEVVARLLEENPDFRTFLETPRIALREKKAVIREVFRETLPPTLINFLLVTLDRRRQRLLREIAREYHLLLDVRMNRERVEVTVARPLDDTAIEQLQQRLTALLGREAIPSVRVQPAILGGVVIRAGNTIYDGSLRRRLDGMRRSLLTTQLHPEGGA
jgi:F-type H+-transporting ATPase subunit delta